MISGYSGYSGYSGFSGSCGVSGGAVVAELKVAKKPYYGVQEEDAVLRFIVSTDVREKRHIYNTELKKPIDKMIESIIRTYRLYRKEYTFTDLHADTLSFLITKFDKFDPTMHKKSFSYFGTICRNYLYGEMIKAYKKSTRTVDYEEVVTELMSRSDMIIHIDTEDIDMNHFINKLVDEIKLELTDIKLTENERKIGVSLVEILMNWNILFENFSGINVCIADGENGGIATYTGRTNINGTPKFNKNLILLYLRDMTGLNTKEIRNAMRRFKSLYYLFKDNYIT